jgi:hypothetical protein
LEVGFAVLVVDADAALDGNGNIARHQRPHPRHALSHQLRLRHQARSEAPPLHPVGRTPNVEVDFIVASLSTYARRSGKLAGIGAAKLQRHRMLARIKTQQPHAVTVQHRLGRHHLSVEQRVSRQLAMEHAAMPVRPVHHRCNTESM